MIPIELPKDYDFTHTESAFFRLKIHFNFDNTCNTVKRINRYLKGNQKDPNNDISHV